MFKNIRKNSYKLIVAQLGVLAVLLLIWWFAADWKSGYSAVLGGVAVVIPSVYFIARLFRDKIRTPRQIVIDFYLGELLKLVVSVLLLILILRLMPVKLVPLLTGYIGAYLAIWLMPLFIK